MKQLFTTAKNIILLIAMITAISATASAQPQCSDEAPDSPDNPARSSLRSVYYECGPLPPEPTLSEVEKLNTLKANPDLAVEAKFLQDALGGDLRLQVWANRDHDKDGVFDYRVSKSGEFRENDTDVDCDGISNVLDATPYGTAASDDPSVCIKEPARTLISADGNNNGIPDHIDWRLLDPQSDGPTRPAEIQEGLFRDYGIMLVDRRKRITPDMASEVNHIIRNVYRGKITAGLESLRTITADIDVCHAGNWALAGVHNSTLIVFPDTLDLNPFLRLEVLVHEFAHFLQYQMDYSEAHLYWLRSWNGWQADGFHAYARKLGWQPQRDHKAGSYNYYGLVAPNCEPNENHGIYYPYHWTFKGQAGATWKDTWDFHVATNGNPIASNSGLKKHNLVSKYAFTDAWEWHAEYTAAYAMNRIVDAASSFCNAEQQASLKSWLHTEIQSQGWQFNHENGPGLDVYEDQIAKQFSNDDDTWAALANYFVRVSNPQVCGLQVPGTNQ